MPVSSNDFLQFASECLSREEEIWYRNATARAYYAAYHYTRKRFPQAPQKSHESLIQYLTGKDATRTEVLPQNLLKSLGFILHDMKKYRVTADYELDKTISLKDAENAIQQCNKLIQKITEASI
ncbi:TPA: HEPN domain-containing protein [Klebsiella oxytoca]|uniref:HEPN domain-containing protein n=1 Tax=Klebsiella oxytoca TaxID=571 RepID=A0AAN5LG25_KLEOX|nr:HEPN domain-containing protein [Klebsiella oxytoca]